jgi:hypothetical protein
MLALSFSESDAFRTSCRDSEQFRPSPRTFWFHYGRAQLRETESQGELSTAAQSGQHQPAVRSRRVSPASSLGTFDSWQVAPSLPRIYYSEATSSEPE